MLPKASVVYANIDNAIQMLQPQIFTHTTTKFKVTQPLQEFDSTLQIAHPSYTNNGVDFTLKGKLNFPFQQ